MSDNALPTYSDYPLKDVFLYGSCAIEPRDHLFTDRYGSQSAISRFVLVGVCPEGDDLLYLDAYMMAPFWKRTRTALGEQRAEFADGLVGFESEEDARAFMADFGIEETGLEIIYAVVEDNKQRIQSHGLNDGKEMKMAENNEVKVPEAKETGKKNIPLRIHKSLVGESFEYKAGETSKMMRRAAFYVPDEENPGSDKRLTAIFDEKAFKDDKFNPNFSLGIPSPFQEKTERPPTSIRI